MEIRIHLPRQSEATLVPELRQDLSIRPIFYKAKGWVPVFYFTTKDTKGNEERWVFSISAANKMIKVDRLVEVVPDFEKEEPSNDTDPGED